MKLKPVLLAVFTLATCLASASAATFEFSYQYSVAGGSHLMTGTFSGVRNSNGTALDLTDDYLETPSVLSAAFDGNAMISSPLGLILRQYDDSGFHDGVAPNVYFAVASNNFIISPCDSTACLINYYNNNSVAVDIFFLRAGAPPNVQYYTELNPNVAYNDTYSSQGTWMLKEVNAVPEPSSYAMFGCAIAGLLLTFRRRSKSRT